MNEITLLEHPDGVAEILELGGGRRRITVRLFDEAAFVKRRTCETNDPVSLIEMLLTVKGLGRLCEAVMRGAPEWVEHTLNWAILGHVSPEVFTGKRILDYGCGHGASAVVLGRMFPDSNIIGVDIDERLLPIARARCEIYGIDKTEFIAADSGVSVPGAVGEVDFIVLSGVYEHLLPDERESLLPALWRHLRPDGVLFIAETPHRYSPMSLHTTRLPLINYLPERFALEYARRFSQHVARDATWEELLRRGIRGGTISGMVSALETAKEGRVQRIIPQRLGLQDEFDLWCTLAGSNIPRRVARTALLALRAVKRSTNVSFMPTIAVAFQKLES